MLFDLSFLDTMLYRTKRYFGPKVSHTKGTYVDELSSEWHNLRTEDDQKMTSNLLGQSSWKRKDTEPSKTVSQAVIAHRLATGAY